MRIDKDLDQLAEAYRSIVNPIKENNDDLQDQIRLTPHEGAEALGPDPDEVAEYNKTNDEIKVATEEVASCLKDHEAEIQSNGTIHFVCNGKGYTLTVDLAKW
jgi:hypothetical protein